MTVPLILSLILSILCMLAVFGTLWSSARGSKRGRYTCKPLASLAFILVALTGGALAGDGPAYGQYITVGLVLGAVGDVALMLPGRRSFLIGLIAFLLGHIAYVLAFASVTPIELWSGPFALLPVAIGVFVVRWLWPHLGPMRKPVLAYVAVITAMVIGALAMLRDDGRQVLSDPAATLGCVGALAFFASDLAVARQRFVRDSFSNRLWGLPAYYVGQLLLAWSANPAV